MKTRKLLYLFTTVSSMVLCSCGINGNSSSETTNPTSGSSKDSSQQTSQRTSERTSMPTYEEDHVKLFVAKTTNKALYTHVYAWTGSGQSSDEKILGTWPGTTLSDYNSDWKVFDFDSQYTTFSIVINNGGNGEQSSDLSLNGVGAYWYYNDQLEKNDTMPDINPPSSSSDPETSSSSQSGGTTSDVRPTNQAEGNIFHAFDWSLNVIKNNLQAIKDAGYTTIQTSPLQRPKHFYDGNTNNDWWKLYQPFSFDVPSSGTYLGSGSDLRSLTQEAHNKGLKIIVDVVANHMGGDGDSIDSGVAQYEPEIYNNQGDTIHHNGQCSNWGDRWSVTQQRMGGYPDLNTSNYTVQNAVYDYLKELVDYGVDGFRFDAAKHIETPFDNDNFKSDFWKNTATKAYTYAAGKNKTLFMYGEILDNCGGIGINNYTNLLDAVTDNKTGNDILAAVESGNSSGAAKSSYVENLSAEKTVLWGESHDTYLNNDGSSRNSSQENVDKAYALVGARKGTRALYFARPNMGAKLGSGSTQNNNYKSALIKAVNTLKKDMGSNNESVRSDGSIAYVARYGNNRYGASIVNVNGSGNATLTLSDLIDGTYKDLLTGTTYTMSNHQITVNIGSTGAVVIEKI